MRTHFLCEDLRLGRIGRRFLSVDVALTKHHTDHWGGRVIWHPGGQRSLYRGWFDELSMQSRIRWYSPDRSPSYEPGLAFTDEWDTPVWIGEPDVERADLRRLETIGREYRANITTLEDGTPLNEVRFIPVAIVNELHSLVERLGAQPNTSDRTECIREGV